MKDSGFNPKMVYRNLPPTHLYEKVSCPPASAVDCKLPAVQLSWLAYTPKQTT
jgi:hypothetical protein